MAVATKTPAKKAAGVKKAAKPLPDYQVGMKLVRKTDLPVIVGRTKKGMWILEEETEWGAFELNTYTTAELAKMYNVLEG